MSTWRMLRWDSGLAVSIAGLGWLLANLTSPAQSAPGSNGDAANNHEWAVPSEKAKLPFEERQPLYFLTRSQNLQEWEALPAFWNATTEKVKHPQSGAGVERKAVKIKVPLGLTQAPTVPLENPPTVQQWTLGKRLFFDTVLSSDLTVACATCHDPGTGFTTNTRVSTGIGSQKGGMNAPTVLNAGYNLLQFWDGRAVSLEDQAQGPVQNPIEMFDGQGNPWQKAVERVRQKGDYTRRFLEAFGTPPTRDTIAKAIAAYERSVLSGNSIHDRADLAMRRRVVEEESTNFIILARDYEAVLKEAFKRKDVPALFALGLDVTKDLGKVPAVAKSLDNGRTLFFGKANCSLCHVGENFTDNQFHNLGVAVTKEGHLPADGLGRFGRLMTGHKNPELMGAFKTPTLRGLAGTGPYMHDGSEDTLEKVVEFYDRGGNANEFLDPKMRDQDTEKAVLLGKPPKGVEVRLFGADRMPIVPKRLNLTEQDKKDLVLFMRALQGDPLDPMVADREKLPLPNGSVVRP